jgi:6-phosphofructokinase 1
MGRQDGVAVVAEGVAAKMDPSELARVSGVEVGHDAHGNIRLEKIPLASIIEREMVRRFAERGEAFPLVSVTLGYELRCAAPIPFDIDYTRTLGYGAARFLLRGEGGGPGQTGGMICLEDGRLRVLPFEELQQAETGRIRTRMVDTNSEHYLVAREYMIRLNGQDLNDHEASGRLAQAAGMNPGDFVTRFTPAVDSDSIRTAARAGNTK